MGYFGRDFELFVMVGMGLAAVGAVTVVVGVVACVVGGIYGVTHYTIVPR
jgi:hypothetical protein